MIICSNCGAINTDETSRFCRKCGALLPVTSKPPRIHIPVTNSKIQENETSSKVENKTAKSKNTNQKVPFVGREAGFFGPKAKIEDKPNQLELQEIPKPKIEPHLKGNSSSSPKIIESDLTEIPIATSEKAENGKKDFLKEITPKPFNGSIIASKSVYRPPDKEISEDFSIQSKTKDLTTEDSLIKQKQLEEDMSDVLAVLSKKLSISKEKISKPAIPKTKEAEKEIVPASMNEILKQLLNLDTFIEASALIKGDGTILASALSNRISDSLFVTIGQNLSMIGTDIIEGLSAGKLNSISIRGTEGVFDLARIFDKKIPELRDMILMIFSHPKVKPGIISFAVNIVKRQIKEYLGIKK